MSAPTPEQAKRFRYQSATTLTQDERGHPVRASAYRRMPAWHAMAERGHLDPRAVAAADALAEVWAEARYANMPSSKMEFSGHRPEPDDYLPAPEAVDAAAKLKRAFRGLSKTYRCAVEWLMEAELAVTDPRARKILSEALARVADNLGIE
jgi:hypothetical protein